MAIHIMQTMRSPEGIVTTLARSPFRRKFKLSASDRTYLHAHGMGAVLAYAQELVSQRLGPAEPENDGRQTPFRGHPVFVAQHGTATCCRRCLQKWHYIPEGRVLTSEEENYVVNVIEFWLQAQSRPRRNVYELPSATA